MRWRSLTRVQQQGLLQKLYRRAFTVDQRKKHTSGTERLWERAAEGKIEADGPEFFAECIRRTSVSDPWDCLGPGTRFDADGVEIDEDAGTETRPHRRGTGRAARFTTSSRRTEKKKHQVTSSWMKQQCAAWLPRPLHRPWQMQMHRERETRGREASTTAGRSAAATQGLARCPQIQRQGGRAAVAASIRRICRLTGLGR